MTLPTKEVTMKTFNYISRPSAYDTARALANRDDAIQGSRKIEIPEMTYSSPITIQAPLWAFLSQILP